MIEMEYICQGCHRKLIKPRLVLVDVFNKIVFNFCGYMCVSEWAESKPYAIDNKSNIAKKVIEKW